MTQDVVAATAPAEALDERLPDVLHGLDPERGNQVTWHFTRVGGPDVDGRSYLIERVEGTVRNPDVWMQACKVTTLVTEAEVIALLRAAAGPTRSCRRGWIPSASARRSRALSVDRQVFSGARPRTSSTANRREESASLARVTSARSRSSTSASRIR